ncbi:MAG: hypothetical protein KatS3mg076_0070 [Candidatus Binatia bacterium]|nr:MAG: hypothetical protein KatS3mg076_0070 [Candidatus Binatia bacterium]
MPTYKCPVCGKPLTKAEYERALKIHQAREKHLREQEERLKERERELLRRIQAARREAQEKERKRAERLMAGWKTKVKTLEERIRQLEKGTTPQTEGLEFEETLAQRLAREFRHDSIERKGKNGDVLHFVRFENTTAGIIIYECKRTPKILAQHVRQAYKAKQLRQADFAVLVTTGQKKGFSGLAQMNGVLVVSPLGAIPLASLLREHLIEMTRARITKEKRAAIAQRLMEYITSPQFKNPIEEVIQATSELQEMIQEEARQHVRIWQKRWDNYQKIRWDSTHIRDNLQLVIHGKEPRPIGAPKAPPLQLPAPASR